MYDKWSFLNDCSSNLTDVIFDELLIFSVFVEVDQVRLKNNFTNLLNSFLFSQ